jgi:hypothetical protein
MAALTNHMPVPRNDPNGLVEAGYRLKAWQPATEQARKVLVLQAWPAGDETGEPVREVEIPLWHPNLFGIDIEDVDALERATDELVRELTPKG